MQGALDEMVKFAEVTKQELNVKKTLLAATTPALRKELGKMRMMNQKMKVVTAVRNLGAWCNFARVHQLGTQQERVLKATMTARNLY